MMTPPIEGLLERAGSKFTLVTLGSKRARQINPYYNQLSEGLGSAVPPQVPSTARKPLSLAFEEIQADKIVGVWPEDPRSGASGKSVAVRVDMGGRRKFKKKKKRK